MSRTDAQKFADAHGLSLDEAEVILARRARALNPQKLSYSTERLRKALDALEAAQKKVGVHPVAVAEDGLAKVFDPEAEKGLEQFYASKGDRPKRSPGGLRPSWQQRQLERAVEDISQDPEDY